MPVLNRIAGLADEMKEWRQHLHRNPETGFDCYDTAAFVAARLAEFGVDEIHEEIATTGIVAIINGQGDGPTIGLRADMDALPMTEATGLPHASERAGAMHACGHDGHTAMLLGAAKYLAETRRFSGRVALIFQPAEEEGGGAGVMVEEGIMDRFDIAQVYGLHNHPGLALGQFETRVGPLLASVDDFHIKLTGKGGHAAHPDACIDPLVAGSALVQAIQTIVSRSRRPLDEIVISVTQFHAGSATNVIPHAAELGGTIRTFDPDMRDLARRRMSEVLSGIETTFGVKGTIDYLDGYPPTVNDAEKTAFAVGVASEISGADNVNSDGDPSMGAEDFSFLLEARPGAFIYLGIGDAAPLHHPEYDFNDEAAPYGASYLARLVETAQPV